jgi:rare lipoprotein A
MQPSLLLARIHVRRRRHARTIADRRASLAAAVFALLVAACGGAARGPGPATASRLSSEHAGRQRGLASYYASSLAGHRTASGERYQPSRLTAAHRRLPFGTLVRVRRVDGAGRPYGPSVVVRVNDRGPFDERRVIDLSHAAARALGMLRDGVVPVELEVVDRPEPPVS